MVKKSDGNFGDNKSFRSFASLFQQMDPKERIQLKTTELFLQFGIRSVSMDDIANALGMSKKTLYQYYADKDELVQGVIDQHLGKSESDCSLCRLKSADAIHEIFLTMEQISEELSNMNPMLLYDLEKFHYKAFQRFREHKDKFLRKVVQDNIEWGMREGVYRDDIDVEIMSRFRLESMMIPFNIQAFPPGKFNVAEVTTLLLEHFIFGIATLKGHQLIQQYKQENKSTTHDKKMVP